MAIGATQAAADLGKRVPNELSAIGLIDMMLAHQCFEYHRDGLTATCEFADRVYTSEQFSVLIHDGIGLTLRNKT